MTQPRAMNFSSEFLRIRGNASVEPLTLDAAFWPRLIAGELGDFRGEWMVSCTSFDSDWRNWEMHPSGDEVVCLLSGSVTFIVESDEGPRGVKLETQGAFLVVPQGTWHTAKTTEPCRMLFITPGAGTQHRPR